MFATPLTGGDVVQDRDEYQFGAGTPRQVSLEAGESAGVEVIAVRLDQFEGAAVQLDHADREGESLSRPVVEIGADLQPGLSVLGGGGVERHQWIGVGRGDGEHVVAGARPSAGAQRHLVDARHVRAQAAGLPGGGPEAGLAELRLVQEGPLAVEPATARQSGPGSIQRDGGTNGGGADRAGDRDITLPVDRELVLEVVHPAVVHHDPQVQPVAAEAQLTELREVQFEHPLVVLTDAGVRQLQLLPVEGAVHRFTPASGACTLTRAAGAASAPSCTPEEVSRSPTG